MKAVVKFFEKGYEGIAPEIEELREQLEFEDRDEMLKYAKEIDIPASVEYIHIFHEDATEPIAIVENGIRDLEEMEWIVEPDEDEDEDE